MVDGLVESQAHYRKQGRELDLEEVYCLEMGPLPEPEEEQVAQLKALQEANAPESEDDPVAAAHWGGRERQAYLKAKQSQEPSA